MAAVVAESAAESANGRRQYAWSTWPYSSGWGYYPSGGIGLLLLIVIILLVLGRI